jgi:DNA (cytosine-5)-methyltransferase 1
MACTKPNADDRRKRSKSELWSAYVTCLRQDKKGSTTLDMLWLYEPADTTLVNAYYPYENGLFLSDNCSCGKDRIPLDAVVAKLNISWLVSDPHTCKAEFFFQQKSQTVEAEDSYGFVLLTFKDFN